MALKLYSLWPQELVAWLWVCRSDCISVLSLYDVRPNAMSRLHLIISRLGPGQSRTKSIMMFLSIYCEGEAFQMDSWPNIVALILFCLCTVQHILIGGAAFNTFAIGWPSNKPQKPACDVNPPVLNKHDFSKCLQLRLCAFSPTHVRDERGRICVTEGTLPCRQENLTIYMLSVALKVPQVLPACSVGVRCTAPGIPLRAQPWEGFRRWGNLQVKLPSLEKWQMILISHFTWQCLSSLCIGTERERSRHSEIEFHLCIAEAMQQGLVFTH